MITGDDDWLDALAGRGAAGADAPRAADDGTVPAGARREGAALRDAIRARRRDEGDDEPAVDPRREAALLQRARREGLLPRAGRRWPALAAAAAVATLALGIGWLVRTPGEPQDIVRGQADTVQRVVVADPAAAQASLLQSLRQAGIEARGYRMLGREGVDAELPDPVPAGVAAVLGRWRVAVPADRVLRVEFEAEDGP